MVEVSLKISTFHLEFQLAVEEKLLIVRMDLSLLMLSNMTAVMVIQVVTSAQSSAQRH